ncbi:MAG: DNA repair protein RecO [Desulfobulbaceae bacterium]|nr:MAG: DNA repair protein RecO [Desulfobulbaceae bacterium]
MPVIRSDLPALVLDSLNYGESDKIVVFYCQEVGRLSALARGAHRSQKRFVNKLELFTFLQISYSKSSAGSLFMLDEAELVNSFITLRTDVASYQVASIIREYMLLTSRENSDDDQLFQLALWALHTLNIGIDQRQVLALFMIKFFDVLGYRPDFSVCQGCGTNPAEDKAVFFNVQSGTITCRNCSGSQGSGGRLLAPGTTKMIMAVQQQPVSRLSRFKPSGAVLEQMLDCSHRYSLNLFQRDIHSWRALKDKSSR